jgi:hypothetical protein
MRWSRCQESSATVTCVPRKVNAGGAMEVFTVELS